jgi:hypothetical protein
MSRPKTVRRRFQALCASFGLVWGCCGNHVSLKVPSPCVHLLFVHPVGLVKKESTIQAAIPTCQAFKRNQLTRLTSGHCTKPRKSRTRTVQFMHVVKGEFVTANEIARLVAHRCITDASISVQCTGSHIQTSTGGEGVTEVRACGMAEA